MTSTLRTIVADLEDRPGVLNRVVSLFRRRNYNIVSLNVGRTHVEGVSRMTLVVDADEEVGRRIVANLYKLVNVLHVDDLTQAPAVARDLVLVKVRVAPERRTEIFLLSEVFRARVVDVGAETLVLEITGTDDKLDGLQQALEPFGIVELVRTGTVSMRRGGRPSAAAPTRPIAAA